MDEARVQEYLVLIDQLLNCPRGSESEILQANLYLLDHEFIRIALMVAEQAAQQGQDSTSQFLLDLAQQISEAIGTERVQREEPSLGSSVEGALQLLQELVQTEQQRLQTQGSQQIIFAVLHQHLANLNLGLVPVMQRAVRGYISQNPKNHEIIAALIINISTHISQFPFGNRGDNLEIALAGYGLVLKILTREQNPTGWALTQYHLASVCSERIQGNQAENLEHAIAACQCALQVYTYKACPVEWAMIQNNLANIYRNRILGDRAENLEQSITACELALQVRTRKDFPVDWAMTQNNLASAYLERIQGDRAENLEQAIAAYNLALQVYTHINFPTDWAMIQNNLAAAYFERILGDRAENLEQSITACELALQVRTRENFPVDWAMTQNNLANAYFNRIRGDRAENLEQAIAACQLALQVRTREDFPIDWAMTQNNLASAYLERIRGNWVENLEQAITTWQLVLKVCTCEKLPRDWALIQNNLANAYFNRIRGDRAENLEQAIAACQLALQVRTRKDFPMDWAMTQNNLASAYLERIQGDRSENLEQAIAAFNQALQIYTRQDFPVDWAMTQNNLANAYLQRIRGDRSENLEQAITAFSQALQIYTRQDFPVQWAMVQNNLANAYSSQGKEGKAQSIEKAIHTCCLTFQVFNRHDFPIDWAMAQNTLANAYSSYIQGDRIINLEQAASCYRCALKVFTPETLPLRALQAGQNLGNLGFREGRWDVAIEGYAIAIAAVEQSRHWAVSNERKQEILEQALEVYEKMIYACIQCGRLDLALQTVERSRSKRLVELMATHDLYADGTLPDDIRPIVEKLEAIQQELDQHRRPNSPSPDRALTGASRQSRAAFQDDSELIQQLEAQKQDYLQQLNAKDPVAAGLMDVQVPDLAALQALVQSPGTALLSFYTTDDDTHIFILKANSLHHFICLGQGLYTLQRWLVGTWVDPYIAINAQTEEEHKQRRQAWAAAMPSTLAELAQRLQLSALLQQDYMGDVQELILTPHLFLHQIPFGALPLTENQTLGDVYLIRYAPSCQVLQFCEQREPVNLERLGIVENATQDLPFSSYECEQIAQLFAVPDHHRLRGRTHATPSNYRALLGQVQGLVSSHHAQSRIDNPLESALMLADGSRITLGQLLSPGWRFRNLGDVFLSCCETGLSFSIKSTETGLNIRLTDDIFTLGTGFLCAGARSVISTLWSVDDLATALFSTFYHCYRKSGQNRVMALQSAQSSLCNLSGQDLKQHYAEPIKSLLNQQLETADHHRRAARREQNQAEEQHWTGVKKRLEGSIQYLDQQCERDRPFAHPVFWAGFVVQGMR